MATLKQLASALAFPADRNITGTLGLLTTLLQYGTKRQEADLFLEEAKLRRDALEQQASEVKKGGQAGFAAKVLAAEEVGRQTRRLRSDREAALGKSGTRDPTGVREARLLARGEQFALLSLYEGLTTKHAAEVRAAGLRGTAEREGIRGRLLKRAARQEAKNVLMRQFGDLSLADKYQEPTPISQAPSFVNDPLFDPTDDLVDDMFSRGRFQDFGGF
jgi:hypothetical protein